MGRKGRGLQIANDVVISGTELRVGDRLTPSPDCPDPSGYRTCQIPCTILFWRPTFDAKGCLLDPIVWRNPIFDPELGTSPAKTMVVDALHTVYYGPAMRWASAVLWRILLSDPWGFGTLDPALEHGCKFLKRSMMAFFEDNGVPHNRRLNDLNLSMLGERNKFGLKTAEQHAGCVLRMKAAEVGTILPWVYQMLNEHVGLPHLKSLQLAGRALQAWLEVTRSNPLVLPAAAAQSLRDHCTRFSLAAARAQLAFTPKFHFFAELSLQAEWQGNPKILATWADEGLNLRLRKAAAAAHHARQSERIFTWLNLQGALGNSTSLFGWSEIPGVALQ